MAISIKEKYVSWLTFNKEIQEELAQITNEQEIQDRFYKDLSFGTGGLRGLMGAGTNRINEYTIKKASYAVGSLLLNLSDEPSIVIAYDTRNNSEIFANHAADIFTAMGVKTYLFDECMPTPILSFAVRHLNCTGGIVITASHNPKEYNGYKVYNAKGGQLVPSEAGKVIAHFSDTPEHQELLALERKPENLKYIGKKLMEDFLKEIPQTKESLNQLKVVYSPLHGAGNVPMKKALEAFQISIVKEQEQPDGNFSSVQSPNPEEPEALQLAIEQAKAEDADLVLATDPDCDRLGVAVKHAGAYVALTGNQLGALYVDYLTAHSKEANQTIIKTIVTSELGTNIAKSRGFHTLDTLTGFKYIGEKMNQFEEETQYLFGYEESYGYLWGTHARDKDAVSAAKLICVMAAELQNKGMTLVDQLESLYESFGYYLDDLDAITLLGKEGVEQIQHIMEKTRSMGSSLMEDIHEIKDYNIGIDGLPKENVLKFILADGSWFAMRPSGTEPKLKIYYSVKGNTKEDARIKLSQIKTTLQEKLTIF